jgi:diketogulonate reductase-like aldo/keto reductase
MDINRAVIVTTSSKKERLERYLAVGDIDLTDDDIKAIDDAGAKGELREMWKGRMKGVVKWVALAALMGYAGAKTFL